MREGLIRRAGPFLVVMALAFAGLPLLDGAESEAKPLIAAAALNLLIVASVVVVPWDRLPRWASVLPPLAYLGVVALLREDGGPFSYDLLALVPVFWLAMYGGLAQVALASLAAVGFVLWPDIGGGERLSDARSWKAALAVAAGAGVVVLLEAARSLELRRGSESRLQAVVENMTDGLVVADEDGKVDLANPAAREMLGVLNGKPGPLAWPRDAEIYDTDGVTLLPEGRLPVERAVKGETVHGQELLIRSPNKPGGIWISMSATPLKAEEEPEGAVAVLHDVSERKRSELYRAAQAGVSRALAESATGAEALYGTLRAIGESMGWELGALWRVEQRRDADGSEVEALCFKLLWHAPGFDASTVEETFEQSVLYSPIGLLGQAWKSGLPEWDPDVARGGSTRIQTAASQGARAAFCIPVIAGGRVLGLLEFYAHEMESPRKSLIATMATIGSQIGEFVERKEAEQEAERSKDEFFGLVSHELRTPLTSIVGYLDLLLEEDAETLNEQSLRFLQIARRNGDRLLRLVSDLLLVTQLQAGQFQIKREPVDLNSIAASSVEAAEPTAKERGIAFEFTNAPVPELMGDADRLAQLLDNLISNALKFTADEEGQHVDVAVSRAGNRALVRVSNTGSYIPPDERARVFERFFRASNATEEVIPGAGLGLTIVRAIVEAHGGRIDVESAEDTGTTFQFWLPLDTPNSER